VRTGLRAPTQWGSLTGNAYWRTHVDKFILRRNTPSAANNHATHVYGFDTDLERATRFGILSAGFSSGRDGIDSTNLAKHARWYQGISGGLHRDLTERFSFEARGRGDYYQQWGWHESMNLSGRYALMTDTLYAVSSWARGFRVPTFTELYYSDAGNRGNQDLKAEKADTYTSGIEARKGYWSGGVHVFVRQGRNLIDWTRTSNTDIWQATNLGSVDFRGIECSLKAQPFIGNRFVSVDTVSFSYTYTDTDRKTSGFFSKYALDIAKHNYIFGVNQRFLGWELAWKLLYVERYYGERYCVANVSVSKTLRLRNCIVEPFISADNFTNTKYSEVGGVLQPGRWIQGGVKLEW